MNKNRLLQIITLSFSLIVLPSMAQRTYHVNINSGDDANDGLKWSTAFKNIQSAIDAATEGDIINVAAGTYYPTLKIADFYGENATSGEPTTDVNRSFLFTKNVKFYGGFPVHTTDATSEADRDWTTHQTILSGDFDQNDGANFKNMEENALHVVIMINPTSAMHIDGFHIMGGGGDESKMVATVYINSTPILQRCGGGIYIYTNQSSSPILSNLIVKNNKVPHNGGGIYFYANGVGANASPTLENVSIINNLAEERGGGFYNDAKMEASPILRNVIISGNEALAEGGGFLCSAEAGDCSPTFENVLISGNKAGKSGGIYLFAMSTSSSSTFTNTTICGNQADNGAGGIYICATATAAPKIRNSVIWGNRGRQIECDNVYFEGVYGGASPIYTYSLVEGMDLGDTNLNGNTDPLFVNPIDANRAPAISDAGDYRLMPTSPLINQGNNEDATLSFDVDGQDRIYGDVIDIGAYEAQNIDLVDNETLSDNSPSIWAYQDNLYIKISNKTASVRVYSISGTLTRQVNNLGEGTHTLSLPVGLYIVTLSTGETTKVWIK